MNVLGCGNERRGYGRRMDALEPAAGGLALRHVELAGTGYAMGIGAPGKG